MAADLVIGLDSSTQSTKAIAWDRTGCLVAESRADIPLSTPGPGLAEQAPADWWASTCTALQDLTTNVDPKSYAALAISNQRETVGFFDAEGNAAHPAITWLDDRVTEEIPLLTNEFGADRLHKITGRPPFDVSVAVHRISWMRRHKPDVWANINRFMDVHGFLTGKLTGTSTASTTSIDAFTVFDIAKMQLSRSILDHLGLDETKFAKIKRPGEVAGAITPDAAIQTGLPDGLPIIIAGGDGECAGLGVNAIQPGAVYLNLGTAIIAGIYSSDPWISQYWRTVTSPTGYGYFLEGCQRAGTFLIDWIVERIGGRPLTTETFAELERLASTLPIGSEGVTMSPYLLGCMDPHWDAGARASFHNMGADHGLEHMFRAALEATTLQIARFIQAATSEGFAPERIIAVGGGATNTLWVGMIADATGLPVQQCLSPEASSLGAAITAAKGIGWYDSFEEAAGAMVQFGPKIEAKAESFASWQMLSEQQLATYTPS